MVKPFIVPKGGDFFSQDLLFFIKSVAMLLGLTGNCCLYTGLKFIGLNMDINNLRAT